MPLNKLWTFIFQYTSYAVMLGSFVVDFFFSYHARNDLSKKNLPFYYRAIVISNEIHWNIHSLYTTKTIKNS